MERLTEKITDPDLWEYKVRTNSNYRVSQEKNGRMEFCGDFINKLAEYEDAEENGLLMRSPCKVGDIIYTFYKVGPGMYIPNKDLKIKECEVHNIQFGYENNYVVGMCNEEVSTYFFKFEHFGKRFFKTREEAEKALENRRRSREWL